jgi:hypothetical protein
MDRWINTPRAFESFWSQDARQATYALECDLDHQVSYIEALFQAWDEQNPHWNLPLRISLEQEDTAAFEERLKNLSADPQRVRALKAYLVATKDLLQSMLEQVTERATDM